MFVHNKRLVFQQAPKYIGVRLDRMLTSSNTLKKWQERLHLESHSSVVLLVQPFGASAKTLRISTQALVFTAAEYSAPDWSRSPHVKQVDVEPPAGIRRKATTLALARKAVKYDWIIMHDTTTNGVPRYRLKSRKPYNKEAQEILIN